MNWNRYGIFSLILFVVNVAYKLCELAIGLVILVARAVVAEPIEMMIWDNAADSLSDGAKIHLYNKLHGRN